mmetsp:Transcript_36298/g.55752  ORF Transcript_36298/g.55752 Transcript_36298/m.55752 type:complete len:84 (-) Transcript_36298:291-542(-)
MQLREQKSKSSLSVMSYNNNGQHGSSAQKHSVQGSGTLTTPLKNLSVMNPTKTNMYFQSTPQQQPPSAGIAGAAASKSNKSSQ